MTGPISRRALLTGATAAAGLALTGAWRFPAQATSPGAAVTPVGYARVGATVTPHAYQAGTTWDQAMTHFNADLGRNFGVAKRYFGAAGTWPTEGNVGPAIQSLIDSNCRGLLCFRPKLDGSDLDTLIASLQAIKRAGLTDAKITLYEEQGLAQGLNAGQFRQVYVDCQPVRQVFPLFVNFSGHAYTTWAAYRPAGIDGIAVDFYANAWASGSRIDPLARWASQAGQELGIWEMGNSAYKTLPTPAEVAGYFAYLTRVQGNLLNSGHRVGDMVWYNGPSHGNYKNTISGIPLTSLYEHDRTLLKRLFDTFNGKG